MRIYILDNRLDGGRLKEHLEQIYGCSEESDIRLFTYPGDFLWVFKNFRPEMVFIRVGCIGLNGLMIAKQLWEIDQNVKVVLVSNHRDYAIYAYDVHAADFLLEPLTSDRLRETLCMV
ncbi:MAG: response regulator [Syntrophomonadaceae bacterium]|nr:response regulator [Syntrophomonadaceae bacterium]